ncbi:flagellar basal-body rod protein FlgF [Pseudolabrys taiwanensis]|uniref:Flagellar basal-body rod protein FlgF n=1 Tax=Pseudolabrys taiwanensis TaxID=331696 RepID=A0A345ZXV3_9HYPH|nr:flagellar basal-body rod protein FlgF [Pseudolabrys taiwanensis]AXK81750.1 flagellar basal-body rod protein FlgF [Pseudolabrys taiwanensis]
MQSALYVSLSAQVALEKRLETIANNMANMKTAAFRADAVKFETAMSRAAESPVAFATSGENYISRKPGAATPTGNMLDVAVAGRSWLAFMGPAGQVYTRDGRMKINLNGELQNVNGFPIADAGGAPIIVDPDAGPLTISRDGTITQRGNQVGVLGLFDIPTDAKLQRFGNSGVIPDRPAVPVLDFVNTGVEQGYVESSNVDALTELTQMITVSRAFQGVSSLIENSEGTMQNAIRTLGEPTKV